MHGRIWRVHFPGRPLDKLPDFAAASTEQLISMLEDQSFAVRQFARQYLWPKVAEDADAVIAAVVRWRDAAETAELKASRALEHQWLGEVAGKFAADSFELIAAGPSGPSTRPSLRSAVRSGGHSNEAVSARIVAASLGDDDALRLEAVVALGQVGGGEAVVAAARTLIAAAERHRNSPDPTLDFALSQSLRTLSATWVRALREGRLDWQPNAGGLAFAVSATGSGEAADAVLPLLASDQLSAVQKQLLIETIAASGDPQALGKLLTIALASGGDSSNNQSLGTVAAKTLEQLVQQTQRDRGAIPADAAKLLAERFASIDCLLSMPNKTT